MELTAGCQIRNALHFRRAEDLKSYNSRYYFAESFPSALPAWSVKASSSHRYILAFPVGLQITSRILRSSNICNLGISAPQLKVTGINRIWENHIFRKKFQTPWVSGHLFASLYSFIHATESEETNTAPHTFAVLASKLPRLSNQIRRLLRYRS